MSDQTPFFTVHNLDLSPDEERIWGGLPRTPDLYPSIDGMTPQDSALAHIVLVCLERRNYADARHFAFLMTDPKMCNVRLGLIPMQGVDA